MLERDAENAVWWVAAAGAFLAWQGGAWIAARGRWRRARERGVTPPPPRLMGGMADSAACFLMDMVPVIVAGLPVIAALAWGLFAVCGVALPLGAYYGPAAGLAGGAFVFAAGSSAGVAVLVRIGERQREARIGRRERMVTELRAGGQEHDAPHRGETRPGV